ncbi:hypothetical protein FJTKL_04041 [Diaporthe vaccinii]|uniref:Uncharacterized protein n=1 Tax=Diaporthe vaccinii TaxID=105482 RepID=A0ABR4DU13_9PEZI
MSADSKVPLINSELEESLGKRLKGQQGRGWILSTCKGKSKQDEDIAPSQRQHPLHLVFLLSRLACLLLLLGLEVLVGEVGSGTTDEHDSVHTDAEAGGIARRRRRDGTGLGSLGGRVSGLQKQLIHAGVELVQCLARLVAVADVLEGLGCVLSGNIQHDLLTTAVCRARTCVSLSLPEVPRHCGRGRPGIGVSDNIGRQNSRMLIYKLCAVVDLVVDDDEKVLLGVVLGNILVGELLV